MANITWPSDLYPSEFSLKRYTKVFRGNSNYTQKGQTYNLLNDRWLCSLSIPSKDAASAGKVDALMNSLRAGANTVSLWHMQRPNIFGSIGTSPTCQAASIGSSTISLTVPAGSSLYAGDMLGISGQLLQVAFDCTTATTTLAVILVGRTRKAIAGGSAVTTASPTVQFRLIGSASSTYGPGGRIIGQTLEFAEDIS